MLDIPFHIKMAVSIIYDILDFTIFRVPGIGSFTDIFQVILCVFLWGNVGYLAVLEVIELTEQIDGMVPICTIAGFLTLVNEDDVKKIRGKIPS